MAKDFNAAAGKAQTSKVDSYTMKDGENIVRLVGGILPRYVYWIKGTNGKDIPVECLSFDRDKEKFTNIEKDWVAEYFPDKKSGWAYSINCIDPKDGKVRVFNLKKKLFEQIKSAAEDLGNPTDLVSGWDVNFKKVKTGSAAFNVEYTLSVLKCKVRALSDDEIKAIAEAPTIDQVYTRPTPEEIKALCERLLNGPEAVEGAAGLALEEGINELGN